MMTVDYDAKIPSLSIKNRVYSRSVRFVAVPEKGNSSYSNFFNWLFYEKYQLEMDVVAFPYNNDSLLWDYDRYQAYGDAYVGLFNEEAPVRCIKRMTLLRNLGEQYGVDYSSVVPVLYDGEATGFGLKSYIYAMGGGDGAEYFRVLIRRMGFYNYFVMADVLFYVMDFFNTWKVHEGFDLNFPSEMHMTIYKNENKEQVSELLQGALSDPYQKAAVRCIKN